MTLWKPFAKTPTQEEGEPWPPASDGFNELLARSNAKEELAAAKAAKQEFDWWHEHFFHDIYVNPNGDMFVSARRKEVEERLAEAVRKMNTN